MNWSQNRNPESNYETDSSSKMAKDLTNHALLSSAMLSCWMAGCHSRGCLTDDLSSTPYCYNWFHDRKFIIRNLTLSMNNITERRYHTMLTHAITHSGVDHLLGNAVSFFLCGLPVTMAGGIGLTMSIFLTGCFTASLAVINVIDQRELLTGMNALDTRFLGVVGGYFFHLQRETLSAIYRVTAHNVVYVGASGGIAALKAFQCCLAFEQILNWFIDSHKKPRTFTVLVLHPVIALVSAWQLYYEISIYMDLLRSVPSLLELVGGDPSSSVAHEAHAGGIIGGVLCFLLFCLGGCSSNVFFRITDYIRFW